MRGVNLPVRCFPPKRSLAGPDSSVVVGTIVHRPLSFIHCLLSPCPNLPLGQSLNKAFLKQKPQRAAVLAFRQTLSDYLGRLAASMGESARAERSNLMRD